MILTNYIFKQVTAARNFINIYKTEMQYLEYLLLNDPEYYFTKQERLTNDIIGSGCLSDMNVLKRIIAIRVCAARNIRGLSRYLKCH